MKFCSKNVVFENVAELQYVAVVSNLINTNNIKGVVWNFIESGYIRRENGRVLLPR